MLGSMCPTDSLLYSYFTVLGGGGDLQWADIESSRGEYVLANDGWVMDAGPFINFANEGSKVNNMYMP